MYLRGGQFHYKFTNKFSRTAKNQTKSIGLIETRDMRRFEIMEIKHGRAAMLGFLHVIAIEAGVRVPGYLSITQDLKFSDVPAGCCASLEAIPTAGWLQIMVLTCMQETGMGFASKPQAHFKKFDT